MPAKRAAAAVETTIELLRRLMRASGRPRYQIEEALGYGPTYLAQVARGRIELKLRVLLEVLEELDVEPMAFFEHVFPPRASRASGDEALASAAALGLAAGAERTAATATPRLSKDEILEIMSSMLDRAFAEGAKPPERPATATKKATGGRGRATRARRS